jgi:predicted nucleotidyltransferase
MNGDILGKLSELKRKYEPEGFIILGIFGSHARGDEDAGSDLDVLYTFNETARRKYPGLKFVELYARVRRDIAEVTSLEVDLAAREALSEIGRKYILPEVRYVA